MAKLECATVCFVRSVIFCICPSWDLQFTGGSVMSTLRMSTLELHSSHTVYGPFSYNPEGQIYFVCRGFLAHVAIWFSPNCSLVLGAFVMPPKWEKIYMPSYCFTSFDPVEESEAGAFGSNNGRSRSGIATCICRDDKDAGESSFNGPSMKWWLVDHPIRARWVQSSRLSRQWGWTSATWWSDWVFNPGARKESLWCLHWVGAFLLEMVVY